MITNLSDAFIKHSKKCSIPETSCWENFDRTKICKIELTLKNLP